MDKIRITLETLYDILRNEKKKEDLQKLDGSFFMDVICYLNEKKSLLNKKSEGSELFAASEKEKVEYELRSIQRILKELYEKREKKIIDIAMNKSRTGSNIIDTEAMLREERGFYDNLLKILDLYRNGILLNLFKGELPRVELKSESRLELNAEKIKSLEDKKEEIKAELEQKAAEKFRGELKAKESFGENCKKGDKAAGPGEEFKGEKKAMKTVKFIRPVPSFVWKDMKVYGPFDAGEEIEIFPEVAELLVRKGRAEMV